MAALSHVAITAALSGVAVADQRELLSALEAFDRHRSRNRIEQFYPETGPLRRELYVKHMQAMAAGATAKERLCLFANQSGKSSGVAGVEWTYHLTGRYPHWWTGHRFDHAVQLWACNEKFERTRDVAQRILLGPGDEWGTGMIPADLIVGTPSRISGVAGAVDTVRVRHVSGGISTCQFKCYKEGYKGAAGSTIDGVWNDELVPMAWYAEAAMRTIATSGIVLTTFTPLEGLSEVVMSFLPDGDARDRVDGRRAVIIAGWDDAPHLTEEQKADMLASIPQYQRDARTKGIPQLGSGAVYPVPESDIVVDDFEIPPHWPRYFSMDVGWNRTAVGWYAIDRESGIRYRYSEHSMGHQPPAIHAEAIRARGDWIPGVIDPAARGRSQADGLQLLQQYIDLGLNLTIADNAVESGIYDCWTLLSSGRFKVMRGASQNFLREYRVYRRDEKGRIVKADDHTMDELRYGVKSGAEVARTNLPSKPKEAPEFPYGRHGGLNWMG